MYKQFEIIFINWYLVGWLNTFINFSAAANFPLKLIKIRIIYQKQISEYTAITIPLIN